MASTVQKRLFTAEALSLAFAALWAIRGGHAALLPKIPLYSLVGLITALLLLCFYWRDFSFKTVTQAVNEPLLKRIRTWRFITLFAVGFLTNSTHHAEMMYPLMGGIIGLSYLPTGRALKEPVHYYVGAIIVCITLLSCLLPAPLHMTIAGLGTAITLWVGTTIRLSQNEFSPLQETAA